MALLVPEEICIRRKILGVFNFQLVLLETAMYLEQDTCSNETKSNILGIELRLPRSRTIPPGLPDIDVKLYYEEDEYS